MGRRKPSIQDAKERELAIHIHSLGLETVEEYRRWCAANGFSCRLKKDWKERCRERSKTKAAVIQERFVQQKNEQRNPVHLFKGICERRLRADDLTHPHLKRLCKAIEAERAHLDPPVNPQVLLHLLLHLHSRRVDLVGITQAIPVFGHRPGNSFVEALVLISAHYRAWVRPSVTWKPRTHNTRRQFASLLRHLFVQYADMPLFFDSVWFSGQTAIGAQRRQWYLHVGQGGSIRACDLPIPYTKRMAHHFKLAPADLTFDQAIRWGQVIGLGGDERLARVIMGTRIGDNFEHDDFWVTVIEWLISNPLLDRAHVGPIIDYLHHQRFTPDVAWVGHPDRNRPPQSPQPNLTMKGRTAESLLRKVNQWHRKLASDNTEQVCQWTATGIEGLEFIEGDRANGTMKLWTIRELLSSKALVAEGRQQKHCVASYVTSCRRGHCSIWTMEVETFQGRTKTVTIEVRNQQWLICQARGKLNRRPTEKERGILRRWAAQAGLTIASYV